LEGLDFNSDVDVVAAKGLQSFTPSACENIDQKQSKKKTKNSK
jgi:hypothetical protein